MRQLREKRPELRVKGVERRRDARNGIFGNIEAARFGKSFPIGHHGILYRQVLDLLFVYGTLRSQFDNQHAALLRANAEFLSDTTVRGRVYRLGSRGFAYPGFVPDLDGTVHGELYRLRTPSGTLAQLDEYEGEEFERVAVEVDGARAWIYRLRNVPASAPQIASGDFCGQ